MNKNSSKVQVTIYYSSQQKTDYQLYIFVGVSGVHFCGQTRTYLYTYSQASCILSKIILVISIYEKIITHFFTKNIVYNYRYFYIILKQTF